MTELSDRVSRLEGAYDHLATKADITEVKGDIGEVKGEVKAEIASQTNKSIGILIGAILAAAALIKYLPD